MTVAVDDAMTEEAVHARTWLSEHGLPTGREEAWRDTPVAEVRRHLDALPEAPAQQRKVSPADVDRLAGRHGTVRIVHVDGVHVPALSTDALPAGLWFGTTRNLSARVRLQLTTPTGDPPDGFEALNRAASKDVLYLLVADEADRRERVHVVHVSTGATASHPRLVVDVGVGGRFHLVESHVSLDGAGFTNASTTIRLSARSRADVHRVQDEADDAVHIGRLELHHDAGAHSSVMAMSRGGAISRLTTVAQLREPEASCTVTGLLAPRIGARHDDAVTVDHLASRCTSDITVRSIVPERARATSSGHVIVRPQTVATVARQRTDSLVLHPTGQADSRPWLEIFADDVRANHGSATGRLDDDALFYLRSRGIPRAEARDVLVGAFARTLVERIDPPTLRDRVARWFGPEGTT
jgi:Fe-S cluster assembly protein SufD